VRKSPCKNDNGGCDNEDYNNDITDCDGDFDQDLSDNVVESGTDTDEIFNFLRANELTELEMNWLKSLGPKSNKKI
jgi:hypothetical protein